MVAERIGGARRATSEHPGTQVVTAANVVTVLRLLLIPVFLVALMSGAAYGVLAFAVFVFASSTDFVDGMIARRTGTVTVVGKILDPLVDRLLIASGVLGIYLLDRLPLWIVVLLVGRDVYLLYGAWVLERYNERLSVTVLGKATTVVLLTGFSLLILGDAIVLPGGITPLLIGLGLVYVGLVMSLTAAVQYTVRAARALSRARAAVHERG